MVKHRLNQTGVCLTITLPGALSVPCTADTEKACMNLCRQSRNLQNQEICEYLHGSWFPKRCL